MAEVIVYHNPRCSKSREAVNLIRSKGVEPTIIEYFKNLLTAKELKNILASLGFSAHELVRKNEAIYKEKYRGKDLSESEWIDAMIANPKLIERPIVIKGDSAIIGRPPSVVLDFV